jgi:signal peptidase I
MSFDRDAIDPCAPHAPARLRRVTGLVGARRRVWVLGIALLVALSLLRTQYSISLVSGESMEPGLQTGDLLLVHRAAYREAEPRRGDIVVARGRAGYMVKRIVGLPGEKVELRAGQLHINRQLMAEPYPVEPGGLSLGEGRLLDDRYALLGDNRSISPSLSVHAVVARDQIVGKVIRSIRLRPRQPAMGA